MVKSFKARLLLGLLCASVPLFLLLALRFGVRRTSIWKAERSKIESLESGGKEEEAEGLVKFAGVESMTVHDILEAPGGGGAKIGLQDAVRLDGAAPLPVAGLLSRTEELPPAVRALGAIRHPNLVPLTSTYAAAH